MTLRSGSTRERRNCAPVPIPSAPAATPRHCCCIIVGKNTAWLLAHLDDDFAGCSAIRYAALLERRLKGEPIQYITGETEFYGLPFRVTPDVLIPRPETEHLVEQALALCRTILDAPCILDVGTGSGAIAVALAHKLPEAQITATDISAPALAIARENASATTSPHKSAFCKAICSRRLQAKSSTSLFRIRPMCRSPIALHLPSKSETTSPLSLSLPALTDSMSIAVSFPPPSLRSLPAVSSHSKSATDRPRQFERCSPPSLSTASNSLPICKASRESPPLIGPEIIAKVHRKAHIRAHFNPASFHPVHLCFSPKGIPSCPHQKVMQHSIPSHPLPHSAFPGVILALLKLTSKSSTAASAILTCT